MDFPQAAHSKSESPKKRVERKSYPEPLVVPPSLDHAYSIIVLHGRGSNATRFGPPFYESKTSSGKTLRVIFPTVKWIFPTAKKRKARIFKKMPINQWFDNWSLEDPTERQDLQFEGLSESSAFIRTLIHTEAKLVGIRNVVIGGLSQGCAMSLHVALNFEPVVELGRNDHLGGYFGMSGWLPFAPTLLSAIKGIREGEESYSGNDDDLFEISKELPSNDLPSRQLRAANYVRDLIDLEPLHNLEAPSFSQMPFFLGHGTADEKVSIQLGEQAKLILSELGIDLTWKAYDKFGHWYKEPDEIDDIAHFLIEKVGIKGND